MKFLSWFGRARSGMGQRDRTRTRRLWLWCANFVVSIFSFEGTVASPIWDGFTKQPNNHKLRSAQMSHQQQKHYSGRVAVFFLAPTLRTRSTKHCQCTKMMRWALKTKGHVHPCWNFAIKSMWANATHLPNPLGRSTKINARHHWGNG